jgi:hypothetical protein
VRNQPFENDSALALRVPLVTAEDVCPFDETSPVAPGGQHISGFVENAISTAVRDRPSQLCVRGGARIRSHLMGRFSHAVGFQHRRAESRFHVRHELRRQRSAALIG